MNRQRHSSIIFFSILFILTSFLGTAQAQREKQNFDFDWKFVLEDIEEAKNADFDDSSWDEVQLPHDWSIKGSVSKENAGKDWMEGSMGYLPGGIGWYRKNFQVPPSYGNKKVVIQFDGVYHQSDVYINGQHLGFHPYGYTTFEYDLTPYLNVGGENTIAVRVNHSDAPSSRWYSGSGIYRHVWLKVTHPVHIATWGTYITTPQISENEAKVNIATTIENETGNAVEALVENQIIDCNGKKLAVDKSKLQIGKSAKETIQQSLALKAPRLWSLEDPTLYTMKTVVKVKGKIVDQYQTIFGVRDIRFDANEGFFLNGKNIKMKGMCLHPDAGSMGTAVPDRSYLRRLQILKEYGVNAIRCSHNPPTTEFLDMCDSLGFLVIDEAFDKWKGLYYNKYFDDWWQKDMDAMVLRDKNHPSIVLWSIGNETWEQNYKSNDGTQRAIMLRDRVRQLDSTRLVTAALMPSDDRIFNKTGFAASLDVVGYNYQEPWLVEDKENFPERIMYVSEAYPYYRGKGDQYAAFYPINPWYDVANNDFVFGQFIWAGVDYVGESSGWPSTGWVTSPFDVCMFEKPSGAFFRAVWKDEPMVRIAVADQSLDIDPGKPHWSWPFLADHWNFPKYEGHVIEVHTTTNCDSVELFLNEKSLGINRTADFTNNTIKWYVEYRKGIIEAKAYKSGEIATTHKLATSGNPVNIRLAADRSKISSDGQDLSHITIQLVDENGILVQTDDRPITVEVIGIGNLVGLDNGDLRGSFFKNNSLKTYFGKALATIQSERAIGEMHVKVSADGIGQASISVIVE